MKTKLAVDPECSRRVAVKHLATRITNKWSRAFWKLLEVMPGQEKVVWASRKTKARTSF